jgi:hypothetical protein
LQHHLVAMAAPQFALPAALAGGLGSYDRTGNLMSGLKSGALTYGLGTLSPGMERFKNVSATNPFTGNTFTQPFGGGFNISNLSEKFFPGKEEVVDETLKMSSDFSKQNLNPADTAKSIKLAKDSAPKSFKDLTEKSGINTKALLGILGLSGAAGLYTGMTQVDDVLEDMDRGSGMDNEIPSGILNIRKEVIEAMKDPSGQLLAALREKYPFLGTQASKNTADMAMGGRIGKAEGGIMDLGGMEKDYRAEGGFVPIGREEKADDVPARLSVNEFVFTADAVRNAGGGDIDKGAEVMENMMKNLEAGGQVSEESQGMAGAQKMFETSERLSEVVT